MDVRVDCVPPQSPPPRLVPCWLCRSGCGTHQNTYFPASCTRKYTRVPTPVPCCSAMPYHTYTPLTPPTPPRSPPGACVVAYAACDKKIQNQDFSFDPPRTPLSYTPLSFAAGGREANAMCVKTTHPANMPFGRQSERVRRKVVVLVRTSCGSCILGHNGCGRGAAATAFVRRPP